MRIYIAAFILLFSITFGYGQSTQDSVIQFSGLVVAEGEEGEEEGGDLFIFTSLPSLATVYSVKCESTAGRWRVCFDQLFLIFLADLSQKSKAKEKELRPRSGQSH